MNNKNAGVEEIVTNIGGDVVKLEQIEELISSTKGKIQSLTSDELLNFSEANTEKLIKLSQQLNKDRKNESIVTDWQKQQRLDRFMRGLYAISFLVITVLQLYVINLIVLGIGTGEYIFDKWVIDTFFVSVFGEITGITYLIVKYLFLPLGKEILRLMKDI